MFYRNFLQLNAFQNHFLFVHLKIVTELHILFFFLV